VKISGRFSEILFEDKAQYFLNNRFIFNTTGNTYNQTNTINENTGITPFVYNNEVEISSNGSRSIISEGPWAGQIANGLFFTCFQPPSKPVLEFPAPSIKTFTPTFNFSNVEDGDEYLLEVSYDLSDTGFTNTNISSGMTFYEIEKDDKSLETITDKTDQDTVGFESSTSKVIRRYNRPLRAGSDYLFRIGNVKRIINIFGVLNKVVNYSDYSTGSTGTNEFLKVITDAPTDIKPYIPVTTTPIYKAVASSSDAPTS
jgi:hypothetical protein